MELKDFARQILEGESLEDKLTPSSIVEKIQIDKHLSYELGEYPNRHKSIAFSDKQIKFPRRGSLHLDEKRAVALHFFANHELLAIEMMAAALVIFPTINDQDILLKKGLLKTIADEQKHFKMYERRMNELGLGFGDMPLNDFFWRQMHQVKSPADFYAVVALTFEQANLDFASMYRDIFLDVDDKKTAALMQVVYDDEISHVAIGRKWMNKWRGDKSLWQYYVDHLPDQMSPARAKGVSFDKAGREKAGLDPEFIAHVQNFTGEFFATKRKEWK